MIPLYKRGEEVITWGAVEMSDSKTRRMVKWRERGVTGELIAALPKNRAILKFVANETSPKSGVHRTAGYQWLAGCW